MYGDFRSTKFAIAISAASNRSPESTTASAGSAPITASQVSTASRRRRITSRVCAEQAAQRRVELLAAALARQLLRGLDAADAVGDLDELGQLRDPRRQRDSSPSSSPGQPLPSHRS